MSSSTRSKPSFYPHMSCRDNIPPISSPRHSKLKSDTMSATAVLWSCISLVQRTFEVNCTKPVQYTCWITTQLFQRKRGKSNKLAFSPGMYAWHSILWLIKLLSCLAKPVFGAHAGLSQALLTLMAAQQCQYAAAWDRFGCGMPGGISICMPGCIHIPLWWVGVSVMEAH